ncbi:AAA-like domain-containing protein [Alkalinema sp. FACHB-956]|uniref:WD40 domain-containing protein n=1 Tax=Alkalinema sp. FACHB-956 TaxID=2692768 RepID=UPI0016885207|nr:AAA-like domain-containing protein [Alkalinema sp. FACHB-956]MBD2329655.1 AAA-like domain-containing protein [Alkalinema sp. FACHB-956]
MADSNIYTVGGTVQANEEGVYIPRAADRDLLALCQEGVFAYVLTPRQMGKSSLMVRTAQTLEEEGVRSAIVDLQDLGSKVTAEQWYLGLVVKLTDQLMLDTDGVEWWQAHEHLGLSQRLTLFCERVLLAEVAEPVVVFVDEIDSTLTLEFTDDFFAAIRYLYVARAQVPAFRQLSFVLIGVATPGDLIQDAKRTPFNIGRRVDLTDFTLAEALPLAEGFGLPEAEARRVLQEVLDWTNGHPYLTQRLCAVIAAAYRDGLIQGFDPVEIEQLVTETFLGARSEQDNNLQFVRDMLTKRAPDIEQVLTVYRDVWKGRDVLDEEQSIIKSHLKMSGVVWREGRVLRMRNRIYRQVFDLGWIQRHWPVNWAKRLQRTAMVLAAVLLVLSLPLAIFGWSQYLTVQKEKQQVQGEKQQLDTLAKRVHADRLWLDGMGLDALLEATHAAKTLKNLGQDTNPDLRMMLIGTLREIVYGIQEKNRLESHTGIVTSVNFSPNSTMIASGSWDKTVKIWSVDGRLLRTLTGHADGVKSVSFSPNGTMIASGGWKNDKTVKIWSVDGRLLRTLTGHADGVKSVSFSPDSQLIASGSNDMTVRLWRVENGKFLKALKGHDDEVNSISFSPNGRLIARASGQQEKTVRLWRVESGQFLKALKGHSDGIESVSFSPNGNIIASGSWDRTVKIWSVEGNLLKTLKGHLAPIMSVSFSPDGSMIASASRDKTVRLWILQRRGPEALQGHSKNVTSVSFSPDGRIIASGSKDKTIKLWTREGQLLKTLQGHTDDVYSVNFSPDGRIIASGSKDKTIKLWTREGQLLKTLQGHTGDVYSMNFSPDGRIIASGSKDKTIKLWTREGQLLKTLQGHTGDVYSVNFSPNGRMLVSGSWDATVRLWSIDGQLLKTMLHSDGVQSVGFNRDGHVIASASRDKTIKLWSIDGQILTTLPGHRDSLSSASFSPDGKTIASGSADKTVILWNLDLDNLMTRSCHWLHDYLQSNPNVSPEDKKLCDSIAK